MVNVAPLVLRRKPVATPTLRRGEWRPYRSDDILLTGAYREKARSVAAKLGSKHLQALELKLGGASMGEITAKLGGSYRLASNMLVITRYHLNHAMKTGDLPRRSEPTVGNWKKAQRFIRRNFPGLQSNKFRRMRRAIALGFSGRLPFSLTEILMLSRAIREEPRTFPAQLAYLGAGRKKRQIELKK